MKIEFRSSFAKDIKKIRDNSVKELIKEVIDNAREAKVISDIKHIEPLTGKGKYFKIKTPPYRFGVYIDNGTIEFLKFGTRENFYNDFPPH